MDASLVPVCSRPVPETVRNRLREIRQLHANGQPGLAHSLMHKLLWDVLSVNSDNGNWLDVLAVLQSEAPHVERRARVFIDSAPGLALPLLEEIVEAVYSQRLTDSRTS